MERLTGGAVGAGFVLIVLPSVALLWKLGNLDRHPVIGLPLLAIFGIMILFGALALISTVFARLQLSAPAEALALPPGSIRAAIALSLIVLFALIAVMLYQSLSQPYSVSDLTYPQKEAFVHEPSNHVLGVVPQVPCKPPKDATSPASAAPESAPAPAPVATAPREAVGTPCTPQQMLYTVHLRQQPGSEATDLAKQLLILIGTLMTSVTSFYFASRTTEAAVKSMVTALGDKGSGDGTSSKVGDGKPNGGDSKVNPADSQADGCDVPIEQPTADADLPAAKGGVAP
jgi:hypothetical protein